MPKEEPDTRPIGYQRPSAEEPKAAMAPAENSHGPSQRRLIDLLHMVAEVHRKLSGFYAHMSELSERPQSRLILEFMRDHEASVRQCIEDFEHHSDNQALESWFQYTPKIEPDRWIEEIEFRPDMTETEIAGIVADMDDLLTDAFNQLHERAVPQRLREAVANFVQLEQRAKIRALRATQTE